METEDWEECRAWREERDSFLEKCHFREQEQWRRLLYFLTMLYEEHGEDSREKNGDGIRDEWMWDEGQFLDADERPGTKYEHHSRQEGEFEGGEGMIFEEWCESDGIFGRLFVAGDELGYTAARRALIRSTGEKGSGALLAFFRAFPTQRRARLGG